MSVFGWYHGNWRITDDADRIVYTLASGMATPFVDNTVTTSKYTAWNFVPLFLLSQFARFSNAYFLVVSMLQVSSEFFAMRNAACHSV